MLTQDGVDLKTELGLAEDDKGTQVNVPSVGSQLEDLRENGVVCNVLVTAAVEI